MRPAAIECINRGELNVSEPLDSFDLSLSAFAPQNALTLEKLQYATSSSGSQYMSYMKVCIGGIQTPSNSLAEMLHHTDTICKALE